MKRTRGEGRVPFIINQIGKSFYKINRNEVPIDSRPWSASVRAPRILLVEWPCTDTRSDKFEVGRSNEPSVVLKRNLMKMLNTVASYIYV